MRARAYRLADRRESAVRRVPFGGAAESAAAVQPIRTKARAGSPTRATRTEDDALCVVRPQYEGQRPLNCGHTTHKARRRNANHKRMNCHQSNFIAGRALTLDRPQSPKNKA